MSSLQLGTASNRKGLFISIKRKRELVAKDAADWELYQSHRKVSRRICIQYQELRQGLGQYG
jgi:hypothetical protein